MQCDKLKEQYDALCADIAAKKDAWLPRLQALVQQVSGSFSEYFAHLQCAGQVSLRTHEHDYALYGIEIRVKFRQADDLQLLTAHHQSGGERSVSTMLYLMALQALTKVRWAAAGATAGVWPVDLTRPNVTWLQCPFRVVDEINQGMDPNNERRVFSQVVHCSETTGTSQYFLVTPKLLAGPSVWDGPAARGLWPLSRADNNSLSVWQMTGLAYSRSLRVLCVFNGHWMTENWNVRAMLAAKRALTASY